jgi:hypothetical protein
MEILDIFSDILLASGLFLFVMGTFFFFVPLLLVKWNAIGNTLIGDQQEKTRKSPLGRIFTADYAIFKNHRITGGVMWGISSLFLIIYVLYT